MDKRMPKVCSQHATVPCVVTESDQKVTSSGGVHRLCRAMHWTRRPIAAVVLAGLCAAAAMPGMFSLPPIDRDEARFAEASRQMLSPDESVGLARYLIPQFDDRARINKPPLIYWLQVVMVGALGGADCSLPTEHHAGNVDSGSHDDSLQAYGADRSPWGYRWYTCGIWKYRMVSWLGLLLAVLVTWRLGVEMFAGSVGFWAAALLCVCAVVAFDVRQARTDQVLLGVTTLAMFGLWRVWQSVRLGRRVPTGYVVLLWGAVMLGVLTKGPITPAVVVLAIVGLCIVRRDTQLLRAVHPVWGLAGVVLPIAAWIVYLGIHLGWDRVLISAAQETVGRSVKSFEGHWAPPGTYLLLLAVLFWPGSLGLLPGWLNAVRRGLRSVLTRSADGGPGLSREKATWWQRLSALRAGRSGEVFCLAYLVPTWIVFECIATKLPHYTMPLYPAVALLCARGLCAYRRVWSQVCAMKVGRGLVYAYGVLSVIMALLPVVLSFLLTQWWFIHVVSVCVAVVSLAVLAVSWRYMQHGPAVPVLVAVAVLTWASLFAVVLQRADGLWLGPRIVAGLGPAVVTGEVPLADAGYYADSLVYLTRSHVERIEPDEVAAWVDDNPDGLVIVDIDKPLPVAGHAIDRRTLTSAFPGACAWDSDGWAYPAIRAARQRGCVSTRWKISESSSIVHRVRTPTVSVRAASASDAESVRRTRHTNVRTLMSAIPIPGECDSEGRAVYSLPLRKGEIIAFPVELRTQTSRIGITDSEHSGTARGSVSRQVRASLPRRKRPVQALGYDVSRAVLTVEGLDYSRGRWVRLAVIRASDID